MTNADFEHDAKLKAKRDDADAAERADQAHPLGRAAALGNAAIQRLLRSSVAGAELDDAIAGDIESKRGGGQSLDAEAQRSLGSALGDDFSDVRVHTDAEANALNHDLQADAFTTGKDIFFREGKYDPGSSDGQKLLAHELTHVTQQRNAPSGGSGMTVSDPGDASERQASDVAEKIGSQPAAAVNREGIEEEEELAMSPTLDREEVPEEEELAMSPSLDREEVPEEEELAMSPTLDREEVPEEEELAMSPALDREEVPEEEELAMSPALDREEAPEEEELAMSPTVAREAVPTVGSPTAEESEEPPASQSTLQSLFSGTAGKYIRDAEASMAEDPPKKANMEDAVEQLALSISTVRTVGETPEVSENEVLRLYAIRAHNMMIGTRRDINAHLGEKTPIEKIRQNLDMEREAVDDLTTKLP